MSKNVVLSLKFTPVLIAVILSILLVSAAILWPVLQQYKANTIQDLDNQTTTQINTLKSLLIPVEQNSTEWSKNRLQKEVINQIKMLWENNTNDFSNIRYFLIAKTGQSSTPEILLDIGENNINLNQEFFKPVLKRVFTEKSTFNISEDYYLSISPILKDRFSLMILYKQPDIRLVIFSIAPYLGIAFLFAIFVSWVSLKLWQNIMGDKLSHSQSRYKQLAESSMDWVWETDQHGNLTFCSDQCFNLLGYLPKEMIGKPIFYFLLKNQAKEYEQEIMKFMKSNDDIYNLEIPFESKTGSKVSVSMQGQAYKNKKGKTIGYRGINRDITKQKEKHENILNMAFFDPLTKLPNRTNLINKLNQHYDDISKNKEVPLSALLFIDLDGFKEVNDTQGHEAGDQLLQTLAQRMQALSGEFNQVFRLGGDEFVVLIRCKRYRFMPDFQSLLQEYLKRLLLSINKPLIIDNHNTMVSASIGIAMIPQDGKTSSEVLSHADSAMYQAKRDGKNCFRYFDASMQKIEDLRKQTIAEIKKAIENNEFELYYQLQIDSQNQKIYGMEALIRWNNPSRKDLMPSSDFISLAVESNNIQAIDEWVIRQSTKDIAQMQLITHRSIPVSINLSAKTLENPKLPDLINQSIKENFLVPADLRLEVTETSLLKNLEKAVSSLQTLRNQGIETSIDDFGTGYSSLSYLQNLPVDTLKIDKSFIDKIVNSNSDLKICRSIIQLAKSLDKTIIAEGVETENQQKILNTEGCYIIQGFLYSKPQPMSDIIKLLMNPTIKDNSKITDKNANLVDTNEQHTPTKPKLKLIKDI
ncbi:hypothetical protein JCM30760_05260 [Thiomicrorhabdus hydrogeniphila]